MTGDIVELHGVTGSPYKTPQVRRKLPDPFTRQRIDLDGGRRVKRTWQEVSVTVLKQGDTVAGFGTVDAVSEFIRAPQDGSLDDELVVWRVRLYNVMGDYQDFPGEQRVFAFAPESATVEPSS